MAWVHVNGRRLKETRLDKGLTSKALAEKSGVKERTILEIEDDGRQTREETLLALAKALEIKVSDLLAAPLTKHVPESASGDSKPA